MPCIRFNKEKIKEQCDRLVEIDENYSILPFASFKRLKSARYYCITGQKKPRLLGRHYERLLCKAPAWCPLR